MEEYQWNAPYQAVERALASSTGLTMQRAEALSGHD